MMGIEPMTPSLPWKCSTPELHRLMSRRFRRRKNRAGDETRTHDPQLGRLMLYQLSYARASILLNDFFIKIIQPCKVGVIGFEPIQAMPPDLQSGPALQLTAHPHRFLLAFPLAGRESQ